MRKRKNAHRTSSPRPRASAIEPLEQRMLMYSATVGVNTGSTFQTIDGFGAAMMTWTTPSEYTKASFYDLIANDLGASIARTAVWPTFEKGNDNADPNSFNWAGYDKNAIGQAMTFLKRLEDRGVENLMATVWTPPAWLKTNQSHFHGGTVRPDLREEYAEYLAAVAISAKRDFGVDLTHLSIQNEPFFPQAFESAVYTDTQMREMIRTVTRRFANEQLSTKLAIPEEMAKGDRYPWYANAILNDPETRNFPGVFATHSGTNPDWPGVANALAGSGHNLWSSESHGHAMTIEGALAMAQDIWNTMTQGNASAYLYWQWSEDPSDGKHSLMVDGQPGIKYHVAKHFYRYVRPGSVRIGASSNDARLRSISFKNPDNGALTHVLFNANTSEANVTLNFSGGGLPNTYKVYRTSGTENHVQLANITDTNAQITLTLPANSIVTLYSGPDLNNPTSTSGGSLPAKQSISDGAITNALRIAAANGDAGDVRELIDNQGADPNASAFGGFTPLHAAAMSPYDGAIDVIHALIDRGADINAKTTEGFTPLHFAAMNVWTRGTTQTGTMASDRLRALVQRGASVSTVDNGGRTALHWAAMMTKLTSITAMTEDGGPVDALLDTGSAINAKDNKGWTALDYAVREGNDAGATELKSRGGVHGDGAPGGGGDVTPPSADVLDVSPDPRTTAVGSIDVKFSEPVTGVDLGDFILMRDGVTLALTGATVSQVDSTTWRVGNLSTLTGPAGAYMLKLEKAGSGIIDGAGIALATSASDSWTINAVGSDPQSPFKGSPFAFGNSGGVTIQAEDYDLGGQGVAFNDTTAANLSGLYRPSEGVDLKSQASGQFRISDAVAGEWIEYTIDAQQAGDYELEFRVSHTEANSRFHAEIDGVNVTGSLAVPDTNSFNTFASVKRTVTIAAGVHVLRFAFDANAANNYAAGLDWIKVTPVASQPPPGATTTIVSPIVTYVRDGTYANTNFGVNDQMLVKRSNTVGNTREGYILFDLAGVTSISNAVLRLRGRLSDATAPSVQVNALSATNTTWTEGGLTWNNKPPTGSTAHGAAVVTGTTAQNYDVNLTSFLQSELAAGRTKVTIVLKAPNTSNPWVIFDTDSTPNGPRLIVTT